LNALATTQTKSVQNKNAKCASAHFRVFTTDSPSIRNIEVSDMWDMRRKKLRRTKRSEERRGLRKWA
jgi:ribosomal protein L19